MTPPPAVLTPDEMAETAAGTNRVFGILIDHPRAPRCARARETFVGAIDLTDDQIGDRP
jgi:hypothetical protein